MLSIKKEAAATTTAKNRTQQKKTYQNNNASSTTRLKIGTLLLEIFFKPENQSWNIFENQLNSYVENHLCGGVV